MTDMGGMVAGAFAGTTRSEILGGLTPRRSSRRVVLLVDDEPLLRELAAVVLECNGYAVEEASSGREAVDRVARGGRIDLVLMDLQMPGMNGVAAADAIAAERPGLPILFVTGHGTAATLGGIAPERIVSKPWREAELLARVRAHMDADATGAPRPMPAPV